MFSCLSRAGAEHRDFHRSNDEIDSCEPAWDQVNRGGVRVFR